MKKSSIIFLIFLVFAIFIPFISKPFAEHKPTVAVVLKNIDSQYWQVVNKGLELGFRDFTLVGEVHDPLYEAIEEQSALSTY